MTPPAAEAPKQRWWRSRRLWIIAAFLVLLAAAPFTPWLYDEWQIERTLAAAVAETDRLDPGWRYEELATKRKLMPEQENAADVLLKIDSFFTKTTTYNPAFRELELPIGIVRGTQSHTDWYADVLESFDN